MKNIKLSEFRTKFLVFLFVFLFSWCFGSVVVVYKLSLNYNLVQQNLIDTQSILFDMQTEYEKVYEIVYDDLHMNHSININSPLNKDSSLMDDNAQVLQEPLDNNNLFIQGQNASDVKKNQTNAQNKDYSNKKDNDSSQNNSDILEF